MSANMELVFVSDDPEYIKRVHETLNIDTVVKVVTEAREKSATEAAKRKKAELDRRARNYRGYLARKKLAKRNILMRLGATAAIVISVIAVYAAQMIGG